MGLLTNLWKLIGPTFPAGYCPTSYQELSDAIINGTQVTFLIDTGNYLYNYGSTTPAPENRIYPWLNTDDGLWYNFKFGMWVSPVAPRDLVDGFRQMYLPVQGTLESAVWSLDSGDGTDPSVSGNVTLYSGAMWAVDHSMDGRFPVGAGTVPNSDLGSGSAQIGIAQPADSFARQGEYAHLLTDAEGAVGGHTHPFGLTNLAGGGHADDAFFAHTAVIPTTAYDGYYVTGSGVVVQATENQANLYTLKANDGNGVTSVAHNTMPPYLGVWWLKHTARKYYTRPA